MRFLTFIISFILLYSQSFAQKKSKDTLPKFSIYLETGIIPIKSQNTTTQICYQGQLALIYNIKSKIQIGIFGQTLLYTGNYEIANIDNKIVELSSIEYYTCGITTGYNFQFNKFILNPKLDFGYNFFLAKSLDFPTDKI